MLASDLARDEARLVIPSVGQVNNHEYSAGDKVNEIIPINKIPHPVDAKDAPLSMCVKNGNLVSICGMAPIAADGTLAGVGDIEAQTEQVMLNIEHILEEVGATTADVIKTTVFLKNIEDYHKMNAVYARHFPDNYKPTRSTLGVQLGHPDLLVEVEAWAVLPGSDDEA